METLYDGKYIKCLDENGWQYVERKNSTGVVVVLARNTAHRIILTEQYRIPVKKRVIELPAGLVGDCVGEENEDFFNAAKRELMEETGYEAKEFKFLTQGPASAGLSSEIITFVEANDLEKKGEGGGDETEDIIVHEVLLEDVLDWLDQKVKEGMLIDPKVFVGLYFLR